MDDDQRDDLDLLFARAPLPGPPLDLAERTRARLRALRHARRLTALALLDLVGVLMLALLAYRLGDAISGSGLPALTAAALQDRALIQSSLNDIARAYATILPWRRLLALVCDALAVTALTIYLLRATAAIVDGAPAGARR